MNWGFYVQKLLFTLLVSNIEAIINQGSLELSLCYPFNCQISKVKNTFFKETGYKEEKFQMESRHPDI